VTAAASARRTVTQESRYVIDHHLHRYVQSALPCARRVCVPVELRRRDDKRSRHRHRPCAAALLYSDQLPQPANLSPVSIQTQSLALESSHWQAAANRMLGRSSGNRDWLLSNASAFQTKRTQRKRLRLDGNWSLRLSLELVSNRP